MAMSEFRILYEVSFGNQSLKIQREFTKEMLYYCSISQEKYPPAKRIYEDEKNKDFFSSLEELGKYLQNKSIMYITVSKS